VVPPFVEYDHSTVGVGVPDADALNEAGLPATTFAGEGWPVGVIAGAVFVGAAVTVKVAGFVVVRLLRPTNVASYSPFSSAWASVIPSVPVVAPVTVEPSDCFPLERLAHELPPFVEYDQ